MDASFNTWTSLFLLAAMHGLVLSFLIYRKNGTRSARLMALFLLLFSLTLVSYVGYWTGYQLQYPHVIAFADPFYFLYGPVLFGYVWLTLYPEKSLSRVHLLHLLPFLLYLVYMAPFYLQPAAAKLEVVRSLSQTSGLSARRIAVVSLKVLHLTAYLGASVLLIRGRFGRVEAERVADFGRLRQRLRVTTACFGGFIFCYLLYFVLVWTIDFNVEYDYMISGAMTLFIYSVGYLGYWTGGAGEDLRIVRKYETSTLEEPEVERSLKKLKTYMREERPYRDGELRLNDLAEALDLAPHHLSQILNDRLGMNYFEFVNRYRVEEAGRLLSDPANREFTILHIAYESGFNNKTSFNKAFKEASGMTPSRFRKEKMNGHSR